MFTSLPPLPHHRYPDPCSLLRAIPRMTTLSDFTLFLGFSDGVYERSQVWHVPQHVPTLLPPSAGHHRPTPALTCPTLPHPAPP